MPLVLRNDDSLIVIFAFGRLVTYHLVELELEGLLLDREFSKVLEPHSVRHSDSGATSRGDHDGLDLLA